MSSVAGLNGVPSRTAFAETKNILLLNTFHWQLPWQQKIEKGLITEFLRLSSRSEHEINLFIENLDVFKSKIPKEQFLEYLISKYANRHIDLIIANDFASLDFVDNYLWEVFNKTQIFAFSGIKNIEKLKHIEKLGYITPGKIRFSDTINLIFKHYPKTEKIIVVTGKSTNSLRFKETIQEEINKLSFLPKMEFWVDISYNELINKTKLQSDGTIIFYLPFLIDRLGKRYIPLKVLRKLRQVSSVPIYSSWDTFIGEGIVGGKVLSAEITGKLIAKHALEIIQGKLAHEIQYAPDELHSYIFDQRQLDQFNISALSLPEGSILKYKQATFWLKYKWYIITGLILCIIETFLIFFLVINRVKRLRIEQELRDSHGLLEEKVTERTLELTHTNNQLGTSEEKYRSLSEAAFEGIAIISKGAILEINNNMCKMFGYHSSEFIGMEAIDLVAPEDRENIQNKILSGYEQTYEVNAKRKDNSIFPIEVNAKTFLYKERKARVIALRDITERKAAEKERERLIDELKKVINEIKTLRGIVPICSNCKKIRDDKGYWNQLESFIEKHSDASFSHSMCPECSDKLYGKEDWYIEMKEKND